MHLILICPFAGCMEITWNFICRPLTEETYWDTWGWRVLCGRSGKSSRRGLRNKPIMRRSHDLVGRIGEESATFSVSDLDQLDYFYTVRCFDNSVARSRSKIERSACGFETGVWGNWENPMESLQFSHLKICAVVWLFGDYHLLFASGLTRSPVKNDTFAA